MGWGDLFGGGALRAEIKTLKDELETAQNELRTVKDSVGGLKKQLTTKDKSNQDARAAQKKAQQKLDKVTGTRNTSDKRTKALEEKAAHLQSELDAFQKAMLEARAESEKLRAQLHGPKGARPKAAPKPAPVAAAPAEGDAPRAVVERPVFERPAPRRDHIRDDRKMEHLEELLQETRNQRDGFKERVGKAEKTARDAAHKQRSDSGKAEAAVRDLQHNLRSERKAYRILQMQFEAQVDRAKGAQQEVDARVKTALEAAAVASANTTAPQTVDSLPRKQLAKVLDDAPIVEAAPVEAAPVEAAPVEAKVVVAEPSQSAPMPGLPPVANTSPLAKED